MITLDLVLAFAMVGVGGSGTMKWRWRMHCVVSEGVFRAPPFSSPQISNFPFNQLKLAQTNLNSILNSILKTRKKKDDTRCAHLSF
jgi:hypothetical protein